LHGRWILVRMNSRERSSKPNWLLIKRHDEFSQPLTKYDVTSDQPQSVKTGRSLEELTENRDAQDKWTRQGLEKAIKKRRRTAAAVAGNGKAAPTAKKAARKEKAPPTGAVKAAIPESIDVELATLEAEVPQGRLWLHEIKLDGYRLICKINRGKATLSTRRHQDWTHRYKSIAIAASKLPVDSA